MIGGILKSLGKARTATAEGLDALDGLREAIAQKRMEITALHRAPLPIAAALARFDAWADQHATVAIDSLGIDRLLDPSAMRGIELPIGPISANAGPDTRPAVDALLGLVLLVARDQVRKTLAGQLSDLTAGKETLTDAERARLIGEVEAQLRQAEAMEETAVRSLEESGVAVSRRADADPSIVLATNSALARLAG
ncbi:hypothetical protein [Tabrizicola aquatica]|uniref:hypothetical protein n=1 Tax=Tabrizicola aquatica TaxID=909926 RepID=UPI000CD2D1AE|nr:hypothetical protein [Tabrizicola aquatica]